MEDNVPDAIEVDAELEEVSGGILSQSELDALLAAAEQEGLGGADGPETWPGDAENPVEAGPSPSVSAPSVVELPSFDAPAFGGGYGMDAPQGGISMNRVRDIPLEVTVELGRTRLLIRDILELGTGSIIELDKIAGEPVDLFANGLLVARGEVIVIDDNFGVRVTEIITAAERRQMQDAEADALAA